MRSKIVMVYPRMGLSGAFVKHPPLGLIYASIELIKHGIDVRLFDTRLYQDSWKTELKKEIDDDVLAVGISVMSGTPIKSAFEIGAFIKRLDPDIKVIWGGPHATFFPESILRHNWNCDYVVSGYAVNSFYDLILCLLKNEKPDSIKGVGYKIGSDIVLTHRDSTKFEFYNHLEIPYQLVKDYSFYGQLQQNKRIFPIYSAIGCPYRCAFCSSPANYRSINGKKWVPLEAVKIVDHIEYLIGRYSADYIYFIDDDSFVDLKHIENILDEADRRKIRVKFGFRGARINEIKKMSDSFLDRLAAVGTDILHIGAESGSDRMLDLMHKDCTADDIIKCNLKIARHPGIVAAYNFLIGLPTETIKDLMSTKDLMLRLVKDNRNCIIFPPNRYRPVPGTELFEMVQREWGYKVPDTLDDWTRIELEGDYSTPWCTGKNKRYCNMLFITSYFVDNKVGKLLQSRSLFYKILRFINAIYRPIALFRLRYGIYHIMFEYRVYKLVKCIIK